MKSTVKKEKLNHRALVTSLIVFSGLGLPITGIVNHFYGFSMLTVERHAWMAAHNVLGLLFAVFSVWHVVLNRRAIRKYLAINLKRVPTVSREAIFAGSFVAFALLVFVGHAFYAGY